MQPEPDLTFYEAASQLLPVLFLALVYQAGVFVPSPAGEGSRSGRLLEFSVRFVVVLLLTIGESLSLRVISTGDPSEFQRFTVALAIGVSLGLISAGIIAQLLREHGDQFPSFLQRFRHWIETLAFVAVVAATLTPIITATPR